jgi:hypothetical protein
MENLFQYNYTKYSKDKFKIDNFIHTYFYWIYLQYSLINLIFIFKILQYFGLNDHPLNVLWRLLTSLKKAALLILWFFKISFSFD